MSDQKISPDRFPETRLLFLVQSCDDLRDLVPLYNSKNVKNTHGEVFLLKSNTPLWVFFTYFKLYIWYQIAKAFHIIFQSSEAQHPSMEIFNFGLFCVALL